MLYCIEHNKSLLNEGLWSERGKTMSKLLKRTLTFALILCMLLSVLPAASADDPAEPTVLTYSFANSDKLTKDAYDASTADNKLYCIAATGSQVIIKDGSDYPQLENTTNQAAWICYVMNVPKAGDYHIVHSFYGGANRALGIVRVGKVTSTLLSNAATYNNTYNGYKIIPSGNRLFSHGVDSTVNYANLQTEYAYNGMVTFPEAGEYMIYIANQGKEGSTYYTGVGAGKHIGAASKSSFTYIPVSLTLIEGTTTQAVQWALDRSGEYGAYNKTVKKMQIKVDTVVEDITIPNYVHLELMNKSLTANSIASFGGTVSDFYKNLNVSVATAPVLPSNNAQLPMYNGSSYGLVTPTTSVTPGANATVANPYEVEEGVLRFGFDVTLPEAAYAYAAAEQAPVKFWFSFKVGDNDAKTVEFKNDVFDINEWITSKSVNKAFFVDLQGLDTLTEETEITVTPYIQVLNVSIPCGTINHTYIPAA